MMKGWGLKTYAITYLVFLYAPIALLPIFAFNSSTIIAFPLDGFTTDWFKALMGEAALHKAVKTSLFIAVITSVMAVILGTLAAMASTRYKFRGQKPVMGLIMLPLVLPEIIIAVALLIVLLRMGLNLTSWSVIMGHVLLCTPFAIAILNSSFASLDESLEEAAYDLGEGKFSTFRLITLPLIMPGVISALLISFTISLDEFIIAFFLTGTEPTLPVYLWSMLRFPHRIPVVMALGTILVVTSVLLLTLAEYFRRRGVARSGAKDTGGFL